MSNMYKPEESHKLIILLIAFSFALGIILWRTLSVRVIEASCDSIADQTTGLYKDLEYFGNEYTYGSIKNKCLEGVYRK